MNTQPEQVLEDNLVKQLNQLGYGLVTIKDESDLLHNLKGQLEKHNGTTLSDKEFAQVLNKLNKGNVFERAKILRDKILYNKDNGDAGYLELINQEHWCQNQFQVTRQVYMEGSYKNRYDVTLLINGLPIIQIELKRRGLELKEAFNQVNRYQRHSFTSSQGLFLFVQIFVISNGVNTKYYANNRYQSFKQTFYWSDEHNKTIRQLDQFATTFLEPCQMSKMVTKYIVLHESDKVLMVLRPYQYYATEAIIERVKNSTKNGYIWHTTGSGKTLTSFKASQVLMQLPQVHKVVFVVDRKDLDYQTTKEYNSFADGSIDGTDDTSMLVNQFSGSYTTRDGKLKQTKLIVTTIQKLNSAISKQQYLKKMEPLKDKKLVFIFDECHRSQFGDTHKRIKNFFNNVQLFGFTGTPIFADNAVKNALGKRTTKELFDECLHKYVITDAIRDENVLKFSVEYVGRYKYKEDSKTNIDIPVEEIDKAELMEDPKRLTKIADYIIDNHDRKTHRKEFTGLFCTSSVDALIKYYDIFKSKKDAGEHNLRIATIFSYGVNEDDTDANGFFPENTLMEGDSPPIGSHTRDKLDSYITDYNAMYGTKYSTKDNESFYNYYKDISKRVKNREVDILLVVNMFLTGFDSKSLNTLYADKNLQYHGLIQAFSRTNRILNEQKSQGNIVCFRNLKSKTDDAITLFSNKEAIEEIIIEPYEDYVEKFNTAIEKLYDIAPTINSVDDLPSEEEEFKFVQAFRERMRIKNVLSTFSDFSFDNLEMTEQDFEDYKSKYLDIYDKVKTNTPKEKVSILDDVDFELELIHRDDINVMYILKLLARLKTGSKKQQEKARKEIVDLLASEMQLRSKRELIEKFIDENLPHIDDADDIPHAFESFVDEEKKIAMQQLCTEEKLSFDKVNAVIGDYLFTERKPLPDDIVSMLEVKPKIMERKTVVQRVTDKILNFIETFINGIGG